MTTSMPASPETASWSKAERIVRFGAAFCFIGHGVFGLLGKIAWLRYFRIFGIPDDVATQLMPLIGAVDVLAGIVILFVPTRMVLGYMIVWAFWTALLRPLAGESVFETLERAGNYGVPLALLLMQMRSQPQRVRNILRWTTALLLFGHGALGIGGSALLTNHYASIGLPASTTVIVGWCELALAFVVLARPAVMLLVAVAGWKVVSEGLFLTAGAPVWEFVERAGSYAAPVALAVLIAQAEAARSEAGAFAFAGNGEPRRFDAA
jgi:hypothetical protein